jgi:hypothetical protein
MPRGINAALLGVVGLVMAKAREAFPVGREAMSELLCFFCSDLPIFWLFSYFSDG